MPSLYTPFLERAGANIGNAMASRGQRERLEAQNKLAGDAYLGNPQALQELMSLNPELGAKIMEESRKRKESTEQRGLEKATRLNDEYKELTSNIAKFDTFEEAKNYADPRLAQMIQAYPELIKKYPEMADGVFDEEDFQLAKQIADGDQEKFQSTVGKLISDKQLAIDMFGEGSDQANAIQEVMDAEEKGEPPKLTDIAGMRKEFTKQSNDFIKIRSSFNKIIGASDTGAGDVSLIFAFMKIIDPGSTVRESEFATAEQTAGIPTRIVTLYNKALAGDRLGPVQRANFKKEAGNLVNAQLKIQRQLEGVFRSLATRQNIDPDNVVLDFIGDLRDIDIKTDAVEAQIETQPSQQIQEGATATDSQGNKVILRGGEWQPL